MREDVISSIEKTKIIVIVRKLEKEYLIKTAEAIYRGGIRLMEITFDQTGAFSEEDTLDEIRMLQSHFGGRIHIGAGTVMTEAQVEKAYEAGAEFIISPNLDADVIKKTLQMGMVSIPGTMTPTEIVDAHKMGADFVKIFPAITLGAEYFTAVTAPLNHIKLIAVGGIDDTNVMRFLRDGAVAVGVGSCIVRRDAAIEGEYEEMTLLARKMIKDIG